ncbi:MAG: MATE family efflux transporter [Firmicutes bacterium]|nr:MATE family efflux transporter [Bacillota bacterium]
MRFLRADLLNGKIGKNLIIFTIPIFIASLFQQLYNTVDIMVVGYCLGDSSLAAIGSTSSVYELLVGFALGVGSGMAIVTARCYGMQSENAIKKTVAGSLVIGAALTVIIMIFARFGLYSLMEILKTPADIIDEAYSYIFLVTISVGVMFAYNLAAGLLRAVGDSVTPLIFLILSSVLNVILDIVFIKVGGMGIEGAALATVISQGISAVLCIIFIFKKVHILIPSGEHFRVGKELYMELLGQGFSMGFMLSIVSVGTVMIQAGVNSLGKLIIAGHTASRRLSYFFMMPLYSLGTAFSTYVSQNKGAGQHERIFQGFKIASAINIGMSIVLCIIALLWSEELVTFISGSHVDEVIGTGARYMMWNGPFFWIVGVLFLLRNMAQGIGLKVAPLVNSIIECIGKFVFVLLLVPKLGYFAVIICEPVMWILMTTQLCISFKGMLGSSVDFINRKL